MLRFGQLRRVLLDGAMVVLPIGAIVLLVLAILRKVQDASERVAGRIEHPVLAAVVLLVLLCLVFGLVVRSALGRTTRRVLERNVFEQIPGYRLVKALTGGLLAEHGSRGLRPALAAIEEGQCPALVMEELADGRLVVFVPGTPAPMSGALYVFTPDKVTYLDVPLLTFMKVVSSWGLGLREIIEAQKGTDARQLRTDHPMRGDLTIDRNL
jgi:uncharacterized membrane protein